MMEAKFLRNMGQILLQILGCTFSLGFFLLLVDKDAKIDQIADQFGKNVELRCFIETLLYAEKDL